LTANQKNSEMLAGTAVAATALMEERVSHVPEDQVRAHVYALLGALLRAPARSDLLDVLTGIELPQDLPVDDTGNFLNAWRVLKMAAGRAHEEALNDEYHALFIGLGRGELMPYASWYLTGFLMDKPLALLRGDLQALGLERQEQVHEPEDHAAALCECMAMLISGNQDSGAEQRFFHDHIEPWMKAFFVDLGTAKSAVFYKAVAGFGEQFIDFESRYLAMPV